MPYLERYFWNQRPIRNALQSLSKKKLTLITTLLFQYLSQISSKQNAPERLSGTNKMEKPQTLETLFLKYHRDE